MDAASPRNVLLVQGDSLTLPRESVPYADTWPGLLQRELDRFDVVNVSQSEKTTGDFSAELEAHHRRELEYYEPDCLVVQIGIVDCAPRYFSRFGKSLLDLIPWSTVSDGCFFVAKHLRNRSQRRAYVPRDRFARNLRSYCERAVAADVRDVVLVEILAVGETYAAKNPTADRAVRAYNAAIEDVAAEFDRVTAVRPLADDGDREAELVDEYTLSDGYHLDASGHRRLFERLPVPRDD